jgi:hypothetical protein
MRPAASWSGSEVVTMSGPGPWPRASVSAPGSTGQMARPAPRGVSRPDERTPVRRSRLLDSVSTRRFGMGPGSGHAVPSATRVRRGGLRAMDCFAFVSQPRRPAGTNRRRQFSGRRAPRPGRKRTSATCPVRGREAPVSPRWASGVLSPRQGRPPATTLRALLLAPRLSALSARRGSAPCWPAAVRRL